MKTKLFILLLITLGLIGAVVSICHAEADNINYKEAVVTTTFKKVLMRPAAIETIKAPDETKGIPAETKEVEPAVYELRLDLPFTPYAEIVKMNGQDVTYSYRTNLALEGQECLALVHYRLADMPGTMIKAETDKTRGFSGFLGEDWDTVKASPKYAEHFPTTKADALAAVTMDKDGKVLATTKYAEADATEPVPFYKKLCGADDVKKLSVITAEKLAEESLIDVEATK